MHEQSSTDIAWAAGLFEGEGCFSAGYRPSGKAYVVAVLSMTDRDVVDRFMAIVGCGAIYLRPDARWNHQDTYMWRVQEAVQVRKVIAMLLPYLGERRRAKALEVDAIAATVRSHNAKATHCPRGHELVGDNLKLEPIKRAGKTYYARRCKTCRQSQERDRARVKLGITPDRFRV